MLICCKISDDSALLQHALSLCSAKCQMRVERIRKKEKQSQSITAGLLLRYCLLKSGYDDSDISLSEGAKPYIEGDPIYFSLSHSGEYAACITDENPVGIDIQRIVKIKDRTLTRFCTEKEAEYLSKSKDADTDAVKLWTLKESYLKASGCSTAEAFAAEFSFDNNGDITGPSGFDFELSYEINGYVVAVCRKQCRV